MLSSTFVLAFSAPNHFTFFNCFHFALLHFLCCFYRYALVHYKTTEEAQVALERLNGYFYQGQSLAASFSMRKKDDITGLYTFKHVRCV